MIVAIMSLVLVHLHHTAPDKADYNWRAIREPGQLGRAEKQTCVQAAQFK
jgi:hypothetical protein